VCNASAGSRRDASRAGWNAARIAITKAVVARNPSFSTPSEGDILEFIRAVYSVKLANWL